MSTTPDNDVTAPDSIILEAMMYVLLRVILWACEFGLVVKALSSKPEGRGFESGKEQNS